jgi:hypothetical protein
MAYKRKFVKTFNINRNIKIDCYYQNTSYGFKHEAELIIKNEEWGIAKSCYYNRTWERFEFESVITKLIDDNKTLSKSQKRACYKFIKSGGRVEDDLKPLKSIGMVMAIGNLLAGNTIKAKNDWKMRMLKAGLENKGLIMPDNWDSLTETEKETRLNGVIKTLA